MEDAYTYTVHSNSTGLQCPSSLGSLVETDQKDLVRAHVRSETGEEAMVWLRVVLAVPSDCSGLGLGIWKLGVS